MKLPGVGFDQKRKLRVVYKFQFLSFSAVWADFLLPLILLNSEENYTIFIGILTAFGFFEEINYSILATMCIIYMLPILIVYFMLSSSFSEGFGSIGTTEK